MPTVAEVRPYLNVARFMFTALNFIMSLVFATVLLVNAFTMKDIQESVQIFHADRVLQSFGETPPTQLNEFIKHAYGADTEILGLISDVKMLPSFLPTMYEVSGSNAILRLEAVHCNFMLFSALWIASAFSLSGTQFPSHEPLYWSHIRVMIVHCWNLVGLIATIVIFTATTKWSSIPTSNLFYALIGQIMGWVYQYFHMVECTQCWSDQQQQPAHEVDLKPSIFSTELRKVIYMEFSVVAPMLLVASIMPGVIGIDEWRIQTVVFSSWTLFALLGLHIRFRKSIEYTNESVKELYPPQGDATSKADAELRAGINRQGLDALGYLTYAIIIVYVMLLNAMGNVTFYDPPYATNNIILSHWGARCIVIIAGVLVLETLVKSIKMRFFEGWDYKTQNPATDSEGKEVKDQWMVPSFLANMMIIAFGSVVVKILVFAGLSDVNALTSWHT
jgi:hypothetical protein